MQKNVTLRRRSMQPLFVLLVVTIGVAIRLAFILHNPSLNSDEAIFGLMAKHIAEKTEFPLFYWGNSTAGPLISYIAAPLFLWFGVSGATFKIGLLIFIFLPSLACVYLLAREIFKDEFCACLALLLYVVPPALVSVFSFTPFGYAELLLFAPLIILLAYRTTSWAPHWLIACSALLWGLSLWTSFLLLPFVVMAAVIMEQKSIFSHKTNIAIVTIFFILGLSPLIMYNIFLPGKTAFVFASRLGFSRSAFTEKGLISLLITQIPQIFFTWIKKNFLIPRIISPTLGIGVKYPLFLSGAILLLYAGGFLTAWKYGKSIRAIKNLLFLSLGYFLFLALPGMGEERHFTVIYILLVIFLVFFIHTVRARSKRAAYLIVFFILSNNFSSILTELKKQPLAIEPLARYLTHNNLLYGYTDHWTSYALMFAANEHIIASPTLFHPTFDERYPLYTKKVAGQENVFYVFNSTRMEKERLLFEKKLREGSITFSKDREGVYYIYRSFSRRFLPSQLNYLQD